MGSSADGDPTSARGGQVNAERDDGQLQGQRGRTEIKAALSIELGDQLGAVGEVFGERRPRVKDFRDLKVWEKAHRLTLSIYRATSTFPAAELYGLTNQLRRAAASIPANIAEGCGRSGDRDLARFLQISMGSATELEYHLLLVLGLVETETYQELDTQTTEIKRMLTSLIQELNAES